MRVFCSFSVLLMSVADRLVIFVGADPKNDNEATIWRRNHLTVR